MRKELKSARFLLLKKKLFYDAEWQLSGPQKNRMLEQKIKYSNSVRSHIILVLYISINKLKLDRFSFKQPARENFLLRYDAEIPFIIFQQQNNLWKVVCVVRI